jgi:hypothetical protein
VVRMGLLQYESGVQPCRTAAHNRNFQWWNLVLVP